MNKFARRLALYLIGRRINKIERAAFKRLKAEDTPYLRRTGRLGDYVVNPKEYKQLIALKSNIEGINNPWQGVFAPYWTRAPKNKKHIEEFEGRPKYSLHLELPPLVQDAEWANLTLDEFYEKLDEEGYYE